MANKKISELVEKTNPSGNDELLFLDSSEGNLQKVKLNIRKFLSPKHVPKRIFSVMEIPKTRSGKIVELLIKKIINGEKILNTETLTNPHCLKDYQDIYDSIN